jgi:hypothetical protein
VKVAVCGPPLALSVMVSVAVRYLVAEGVNVTAMVQLPPAATELPQVSAIHAKCPLLAPVMVSAAMLKAALRPLLRVIV